MDLDFKLRHEQMSDWEQIAHLSFAPDQNDNPQFMIALVLTPKHSLIATVYNSVTSQGDSLALDQSLPLKLSTWQRIHTHVDFDANEIVVSVDDAAGGYLFGTAKLDASVPVLSSAPKLTIGIPYTFADDSGPVDVRVAFDDVYLDVF